MSVHPAWIHYISIALGVSPLSPRRVWPGSQEEITLAQARPRTSADDVLSRDQSANGKLSVGQPATWGYYYVESSTVAGGYVWSGAQSWRCTAIICDHGVVIASLSRPVGRSRRINRHVVRAVYAALECRVLLLSRDCMVR